MPFKKTFNDNWGFQAVRLDPEKLLDRRISFQNRKDYMKFR
jgi:hypothetical protein